MDNLVNFEKGHTHSLKHGGYATLIRNPEDLEVADEAEIIGLIAERRMYRARIASALRTINDLEGQIEEGIDEPDKISSMLRLIAAANNSIDRCVGRVESLTKTLSSIRIDDINGPRLQADHKRIEAAEGKTARPPVGPAVNAGTDAFSPSLADAFLGTGNTAEALKKAQDVGNAAMK